MRFSSNLLLHNHPSKGIPNGVRLVEYLVCGSREIWGGTLHLHKISTVGVKRLVTYNPNFWRCLCHVLQKVPEKKPGSRKQKDNECRNTPTETTTML